MSRLGNFLGKGWEYKVYEDPKDPNAVIKCVRPITGTVFMNVSPGKVHADLSLLGDKGVPIPESEVIEERIGLHPFYVRQERLNISPLQELDLERVAIWEKLAALLETAHEIHTETGRGIDFTGGSMAAKFIWAWMRGEKFGLHADNIYVDGDDILLTDFGLLNCRSWHFLQPVHCVFSTIQRELIHRLLAAHTPNNDSCHAQIARLEECRNQNPLLRWVTDRLFVVSRGMLPTRTVTTQ